MRLEDKISPKEHPPEQISSKKELTKLSGSFLLGFRHPYLLTEVSYGSDESVFCTYWDRDLNKDYFLFQRSGEQVQVKISDQLFNHIFRDISTKLFESELEILGSAYGSIDSHVNTVIDLLNGCCVSFINPVVFETPYETHLVSYNEAVLVEVSRIALGTMNSLH